MKDFPSRQAVMTNGLDDEEESKENQNRFFFKLHIIFFNKF